MHHTILIKQTATYTGYTAKMRYPKHALLYLPACTGVPVVGKVRGNPVIDVAQSHLLPLAAVDGECDEGCVRVGRLGVVVAVGLRLERVQPRREVDRARRRFSRLRPAAPAAERFSWGTHLATLADVEPRQPVHGRKATVQLHLRHSSSWRATLYLDSRKPQMKRKPLGTEVVELQSRSAVYKVTTKSTQGGSL